MDIQKITEYEKYYLDDKSLKEYDFDILKTSSPELTRIIRSGKYDIEDYYGFRALCIEISSIEAKTYYFSSIWNIIKYEKTRKDTEYIQLKQNGDSIWCEPEKHQIHISGYTFELYSPIYYNTLYLLIIHGKKRSIPNEKDPLRVLNLPELHISEETEVEFGLDYDIDSKVPLTIGYGEYRVYDRYMISVKPSYKQQGILCLYYGKYGGPTSSLREKRSYEDEVRIAVFKSPYNKEEYYWEDYNEIDSFSNTPEYRIHGDTANRKIYIVARTNGSIIDIREITLYSLADYFRVASWLIVTLAYRSRYVNRHLMELWPTCKVWSHLHNSSLQSTDNVHMNLVVSDAVRSLSGPYKSVLQVLNGTSGLFSSDQESLETDLIKCLDKDLIYISTAFSYDENARDLNKNIYNKLTGKHISYFDRPQNEPKSDSALLNKLFWLDVILSVSAKSETMKISGAIIKFYDIYRSILFSADKSVSNASTFLEASDQSITRWLESLSRKNDSYNNALRTTNDQSVDSNQGKENTNNPNTANNTYTHNDFITQQPLSGSQNGFQMLDSLVGLNSIKNDVKSLVDFVKIQKIRKERGISPIPMSLHLVFSGNPGTGKTTVARILGQLYKEIGVLKSGHVVEVDRSALVAGYVGQTAIKTKEKINEAIGGILFIDEAYTLSKDDSNDFGQEAIDTLLKEMEDRRNEFVVIVAGYTDRMTSFINSNPGLKSRFNKYFLFPDYSADELFEIMISMLNKYGFIVQAEALGGLRSIIINMVENKDERFANAREIRNLFEHIVSKQASRVAKLMNPSESDLLAVKPEDIF